jgi:hypothetical protein
MQEEVQTPEPGFVVATIQFVEDGASIAGITITASPGKLTDRERDLLLERVAFILRRTP